MISPCAAFDTIAVSRQPRLSDGSRLLFLAAEKTFSFIICFSRHEILMIAFLGFPPSLLFFFFFSVLQARKKKVCLVKRLLSQKQKCVSLEDFYSSGECSRQKQGLLLCCAVYVMQKKHFQQFQMSKPQERKITRVSNQRNNC